MKPNALTPQSLMQVQYHAKSTEEALSLLESAPHGLSEEEAKERLSIFGENRITAKKGDTVFTLILRQVESPLIWVLLGASVLAMFLGKATDAMVVLAVVIINVIIGFIQEYKAGKAVAALGQYVPEKATVQRSGHKKELPVALLVPGDIVQLASGDKVPADIRLVSVKGLKADEAMLTGESVPVEKQIEPVPEDSALGDRTCMAFGGSLVTYGTGTAVVVRTGDQTELGRISSMMESASRLETPLTRSLAGISKVLTVAIIVISAVLLVIGLTRGYSVADAFLVAITLAVAAIPEGLPAVVTIALAIGVKRMAARRAIVRKLPAVETLGSTAIICSDKTGTLTKNEMTVRALWSPRSGRAEVSGTGYAPEGSVTCGTERSSDGIPSDIKRLLTLGTLCNDARLMHEGNQWKLVGDPTEGALIVAAEKAGLRHSTVTTAMPRIDAVPFESENQYMASLHSGDGDMHLLILKGAPEVVLKKCRLEDSTGALSATLHQELEALTAQGMRVLAFAEKALPGNTKHIGPEELRDFSLSGIQAMIDPPRPEAIAAIRRCQSAGIQVKMITGDHIKTAGAIGKELGISGDGAAMSGNDLARLADSDLAEKAEDTHVFARVAPEHKLRLVKALQSKRKVVAMTGDGVNDAPALKQADIGIAMGITGTSVSREAADVILTDDNFATIAAAVEEGRRVYDNLIKSIAFILPTNLGLALILILAVLFFPIQEIEGNLLPLMPMLPVQLLWINLVASVALALPLAFEAKEKDIMERAPRPPERPILTRRLIIRTIIVATLMAVGSVVLFYYEYFLMAGRVGHFAALREAQTEAVTTVIAFQIFYMLDCRSLRYSIFETGFLTNWTIYAGIGALLALQALFIWQPWFQRLFSSDAIGVEPIFEAFAIGFLILPILAVERWVANRRVSIDGAVHGVESGR